MFRPLTTCLIVSLLLLPAGLARASGPSFMVEGGIGLMYGLSSAQSTDMGSSGNVVLGIGGRPAGSWLRYYFIVESVFGGYERSFEQNLRTINLERHLFEFGAGARIVAPVTRHIRLFVDGEVVGIRTSTVFSGSHLPAADSAELDLGFRFAGGVQVRPIELLSVGLRVSVTAALSDMDSNAQTGWLTDFDSEGGHSEIALQLTFYF